MAVLFTCTNLNKEFGEFTILKDISFTISEGECIGLVGLNGCGKTTLADVVFGLVEASKGKINWHKDNISMCYLQQGKELAESLINKNVEIGVFGDKEEREIISSLLKNVNELGIREPMRSGADDFKSLTTMSAGERTKLELAKIMSRDPDFIILDEPTNHLDDKGIQWVIGELKKFKGTLLIISHDRYFLDNCVQRILEIDEGCIKDYAGNYTFYRDEKKRRYESELNQFNIQEKNKQKIEGYIKRLEQWSEKAHRESTKVAPGGVKMGAKEKARAKAKKMDSQIKSRIKRLKKTELEGVKKPRVEKFVDFELNKAQKRGRRIIEIINISKSYGSRELIKNSSFFINRGEKIALFGDNGCGKSTLLKIILGEETADKGEKFISPSIKIGYLSQTSDEKNYSVSIEEYFELKSGGRSHKVALMLVKMGFEQEVLKKPLSTLSFGEITRLKIIKLILEESDLLILDEPMNHLDLHSREKLEEGLMTYEGTVVLVSHDRYMVEKVCNKLLVFNNKRIERKEFGLKEYLERLKTNDSGSNSEIKARERRDEKLILESKIAYILGQLHKYEIGTPEYEKTSEEYFVLMKKRNEIK